MKTSIPIGSNEDHSGISPVTSQLNISFTTYNFVVPVAPEDSLARFWFEVNGDDSGKVTYDNGGGGYALAQDTILFVPSLSHADFKTVPGLAISMYHLVAAVRVHAHLPLYDAVIYHCRSGMT